jgi:hypothetical protein
VRLMKAIGAPDRLRAVGPVSRQARARRGAPLRGG